MNPARKSLVGVAVAVAGVITMAAAAFACTTYAGKMTVTPQGTGSSGAVTVEGGGLNMKKCGSPVGSATLKAPNTVQVLIAPGTTCAGALSAATYTMSFVNGGATKDCMYGSSVGSIVVDSNGNGPATLSNSISPAGSFQFCVSNAGNMQGLQAPLTAI